MGSVYSRCSMVLWGVEMNEQSSDNIQFYISHTSPCPYLPDLEERKLFTHLSGHKAKFAFLLLSENGFRRSQNIIYKPSCESCSECKSVRVRVAEFTPSKSQKRVIGKNGDIASSMIMPVTTNEHFELFKKYLTARHQNGGMSDMNEDEFKDMVEDTAVNTRLVEYRLKQNDKLIAVALVDILETGISLVYSFFDPEQKTRSLGTFMILDNILKAKENILKYVYLGYWIKSSKNMNYKTAFLPVEEFCDSLGWIEK